MLKARIYNRIRTFDEDLPILIEKVKKNYWLLFKRLYRRKTLKNHEFRKEEWKKCANGAMVVGDGMVISPTLQSEITLRVNDYGQKCV